MEWTGAIGVDTPKDRHVGVALDALGGQLDSQEIPTTPPVIAGCSPGRRSWVCRPLQSRVRGVTAPGSFASSSEPRSRVRVRASASPGAPAREESISSTRLWPRAGCSRARSESSPGDGRREDLRLLLRGAARGGAMRARTAALNQLSALVVTAPEHVRERLGALSGERLAEAAARLLRLLAAGKTTREARRRVKRALARHFYRRLREMPMLT